MKAEDLAGPIVNHHVRCFEQHKLELNVLTKYGITTDHISFKCVCREQPTIEELNEALEV